MGKEVKIGKLVLSDWSKSGSGFGNHYRSAMEIEHTIHYGDLPYILSIGLRVNTFSKSAIKCFWRPIIIGNGRLANEIKSLDIAKFIIKPMYKLDEIDQGKLDIDKFIRRLDSLLIFV